MLVVANHTFAEGLTGGYVGVDVFFVISGFLITNHLFSEIAVSGRVRLAQFYARRIRRILPASFAVLILTLIASMIWLPPTLLKGILGDAVATALYIPNIVFAIDGTNYLAETAPSPYQHYWSLGVEEQFYLFWPLMLMVVWMLVRRSRGALFSIICVLVVGSLSYGIVLTFEPTPWAFFSLPTRAWELGIGCLVALVGPSWARKTNAYLASAAGWAGLFAIVMSAVFFSSQTAFPGYAAVVPVLGAAAVIFFGQRESAIGPKLLLSTRPMVFLGAISYSLYLVHWPLLVIPAAAGGTMSDFPVAISVALALLSVPLAWLLYSLVEQPFRKAGPLAATKPRWSILTAAVASAVIVAVTVPLATEADHRLSYAGNTVVGPSIVDTELSFTSFVPSNLAPSLADVEMDVPSIYDSGCHLDWKKTMVQDCAYGELRSEVTVALFGDSHAAQWFPTLSALADEHHFRLEVYTKSSCPSAAVDVQLEGAPYEACTEWRNAVVSHLQQVKPDVVVLSNFTNERSRSSDDEFAQVWATGLQATISQLSAVSAVEVIADTPNIGSSPSICLSANLDDTNACSRSRSDSLNTVWGEAIAENAIAAGAGIIDLNDNICSSNLCGAIIGSTLVYRDAHHLTATFATELSSEFWEQLLPAFPKD